MKQLIAILVGLLTILVLITGLYFASSPSAPEKPANPTATTTAATPTTVTTATTTTAAPTVPTTAKTTVPTTAPTTAKKTTAAPTTTAKPRQKGDPLPVPLLCQHPELPTGCESCAAVMALRYMGEKVGMCEFARDWLEKSNDFLLVGETLYGPDPREVFAGDPFTEQAFGCYPKVIENAIRRHGKTCTATALQGVSLPELCRTCIDDGRPVLIWATMEMKEPTEGRTWILPSGESYTWTAGEHCMVLIGYDEDNYIMNDPQTGKVVKYPKWLTESRYNFLGMNALEISKK